MRVPFFLLTDGISKFAGPGGNLLLLWMEIMCGMDGAPEGSARTAPKGHPLEKGKKWWPNAGTSSPPKRMKFHAFGNHEEKPFLPPLHWSIGKSFGKQRTNSRKGQRIWLFRKSCNLEANSTLYPINYFTQFQVICPAIFK